MNHKDINEYNNKKTITTLSYINHSLECRSRFTPGLCKVTGIE